MPRETIAQWKHTARHYRDQARTAEQAAEAASEAATLAGETARAAYDTSSRLRWQRTALAVLSCIGFGTAIVMLVAFAVSINRQPIEVNVRAPETATAAVTEDAPPIPMSWKPAKATDKSPERVLASVRIGRSGGCSGTIIRIHGEHAWGISAAHCASRVGDAFVIGNPDGTRGAARWIAIDRSVDLSLFITWSKEVLGAATVCAHATPDWSKGVEAVGYPGGQGPKWKRFQIQRENVAHGESGTRRVFRNRYQFNNLGPGWFAGGDSGGGVFYDGDHLIGVMTHGGPRAASLPQIQKFLRTHKRKFKGIEPFS